jgi:hypothetical protein
MLAAHARGAGDVSATADATVATWHQVTYQLAPVIGVGGVSVLFNRALQQSSAVFPWLATPMEEAINAVPPATLKARFAGQKTAAIEEASATILLNFAELLTTLIGDSLADRLLGPVWAPAPPGSERETLDE